MCEGKFDVGVKLSGIAKVLDPFEQEEPVMSHHEILLLFRNDGVCYFLPGYYLSVWSF